MDALDQIRPSLRPGERLVVRYRLPDASATDVLGWLESVDADSVVLSERPGRSVRVDRGSIVAARRVPPARGGRDPMRTSAEELQRITLPGWVAEQQPLGEWTLRAGGGFTGRANSCLAVGDPGVDVAEAAERVVAYALAHHIPPWAQVIEDSEPERRLRALGWTDVYVPTDVLVSRLGDLLADDLPDPPVQLSESLTPPWLEAYQRSRPNAAEPEVLRRILESEPPRAFAGVADDGRPVAIGRGHVAADWLGLASIWTDPALRRQGWAGRVMTGLGHWAARLGARNVYLQVAAENEAAHRAYERMGFARHHGYRYLQAPDRGQSGATSR